MSAPRSYSPFPGPFYEGYPLNQAKNFRRAKSEWLLLFHSGPLGPSFLKIETGAVPQPRLDLPNQRYRSISYRRDAHCAPVEPSPLKGEGSGGRPLRQIQKAVPSVVGAGHWPARRFMRRVQEAAPYGSAPVTPARHTQTQMRNRNSGNFFNHRAQWPGGNLDRHSDFARRKFS